MGGIEKTWMVGVRGSGGRTSRAIDLGGGFGHVHTRYYFLDISLPLFPTK